MIFYSFLFLDETLSTINFYLYFLLSYFVKKKASYWNEMLLKIIATTNMVVREISITVRRKKRIMDKEEGRNLIKKRREIRSERKKNKKNAWKNHKKSDKRKKLNKKKWMNVCDHLETVGIVRTLLMSSFLLLQQCPTCLVHLIWMVLVTGSRWLYSCCFVEYGPLHTDVQVLDDQLELTYKNSVQTQAVV